MLRYFKITQNEEKNDPNESCPEKKRRELSPDKNNNESAAGSFAENSSIESARPNSPRRVPTSPICRPKADAGEGNRSTIPIVPVRSDHHNYIKNGGM